jgi:acetylornithine deacetylase/succinyl-diaminopimelate desuccinylase-like protein
MVQLAEQITQRGMTPATDIWWVATVGEEGLGDLRGIRHACDHLGDRLGLAVILEGIGLGRIYHAGMGVRRFKVTVKGPGGHSWLHADRPSAIHHLMRLGAAIVEQVQPPKRPRSSLNIGLITGGTSINTLAPEAAFSIDLRSVDAQALMNMESAVKSLIGRFDGVPDLRIDTEVVGDRPSASLPASHPLVRAAEAVLRYVNAGPGTREIGSTDANIPLARGIPSVCIGITTGGGAHTVEEFIDTGPVATGMCQLTLLALLAARNVVEWSQWEARAD